MINGHALLRSSSPTIGLRLVFSVGRGIVGPQAVDTTGTTIIQPENIQLGTVGVDPRVGLDTGAATNG